MAHCSGERAATSPLNSEFDKRPELRLSDIELKNLNEELEDIIHNNITISSAEDVQSRHLVRAFLQVARESSKIDECRVNRAACKEFVDRLSTEERLDVALLWIEARDKRDWNDFANYVFRQVGSPSAIHGLIEDLPSSGLDGTTASTDNVDKPYKCVVISLIRHAECLGNANRARQWEGDDALDPLTGVGRNQAVSLGTNWADTRIDHLLASPLQRAYDTANALSSQNEGHPRVLINYLLKERRYGDEVHQLMQYDQQAGSLALRGSRFGLASRSYCPPEGGESMNMVASRAEKIIRSILDKYAVGLSEAPEFFLEKKTTNTPADLPDGIPHVVIVGHNVFFMELYEKIYSWGHDHVETNCHWNNTDWSRHILWYDRSSDKLEFSNMKYCCE